MCRDPYLSLEMTLFGGQSFRWVEFETDMWRGRRHREFAGVVGSSLVVLREPEDRPSILANEEPYTLWYRVIATLDPDCDHAAELHDHFRLGTNMQPLVEDFCKNDSRFAEVFPYFSGARMLRQHPTECLFAFICSACNNVKRITGMVKYLANNHGRLIGHYKSIPFYEFPTIANIVDNVTEQELRDNGFGYRAKYTVGSAKMLQELGSEEYLMSLRGRPTPEVAKELVQLPGIGRKVAGCIALMALDCSDEIPCDTHVWQIAVRDYLPHLQTKTLTDRVYTQVGDHFRGMFGPYAGWAHNYLFIAELSDFKARLPENLRRKPPPKPKPSPKRAKSKRKPKADQNSSDSEASETSDAGESDDDLTPASQLSSKPLTAKSPRRKQPKTAAKPGADSVLSPTDVRAGPSTRARRRSTRSKA